MGPTTTKAIETAKSSGAFNTQQIPHLYAIVQAVMADEKFQPRWFSIAAIAARFNKSEYTMREKVRAGAFPGATKDGGEWIVPRAGVEAYEAGLYTPAKAKA